MADSTVTITGNTVVDFEIRFSPAGVGVAKTRVAVNDRRKQGEEWVEEASFFDVTLFGSLGDNAAESLPKGTRVIVVGKLKQRSWEDKETGAKRSAVEIVADSIGPDLRWATAVVTRTPKGESATPTAKAPAEDDPWA